MVGFAFDAAIDAAFFDVAAARHFYRLADGFDDFGNRNFMAVFAENITAARAFNWFNNAGFFQARKNLL